MFDRLRPALLIVLLSSQLAAAQSLPDGMKMHRKGAGTMDSSGWTIAESTEGRFFVRMPLKFNDFTMQMPDSEANLGTLFGIGAKSTEGIKFVTQRFVYRTKDAAAHYFSRVQGGVGFNTEPKNANSHRFRGRPAVDLQIHDEQTTGYLRYVLTEDSLIYLIVEVPNKSRSLVPKQLIRQFLDSLRFSPLESAKLGFRG